MWPALSYHFGIHPWDLMRLSESELAEYVKALDELNRELKKTR